MEISKQDGVLMRGIAILMIVIFHFQYDLFGGSFLVERGQGVVGWIVDSWNYVKIEPGAWVGFFMALCFVGVNVFFVMSGYGLVKKFKDKGKVGFGDMGKQIWKVLIPYWIAHPVIHVLDWGLKNLQYKVGLIDYETGFAGMHSFGQYVESFLVVPRWFSNDAMLSFVGTWWFVGVIVQFYILFPVLFWAFRRFRAGRVLMACVGVSLVYRYLISVLTGGSPVGVNEAEIWLFVGFPARLSEFALGMYLGLDGRLLRRFESWLWGVGFVLLGFLLLGNVQTMFVSDFLFGVGMTILVYRAAIGLRGRLKSVVSGVGKKSYLIYLYHEPLLKLVLKFIFPRWVG